MILVSTHFQASHISPHQDVSNVYLHSFFATTAPCPLSCTVHGRALLSSSSRSLPNQHNKCIHVLDTSGTS